MSTKVRGQLFPILLGVLDEYINESEHQGGEQYWDKFVTSTGEVLYDKLIIDLGLYLAHRGWDEKRDKDLPKVKTLDRAINDWTFRDREYMV